MPETPPTHKVSDTAVFEGRNFVVYRTAVEVAPGHTEEHEYVWRADGTRTIAVKPDRQVLLTREYRHEQGEDDWRVPGGKLDRGEPPEVGARREFLEETGYRAGHLRYLWPTTLDSTVRYRRHFFLALDVVEGSSALEIGERITPHWLPLEEACDLALDGRINEEISALSLLRLRHAWTALVSGGAA